MPDPVNCPECEVKIVLNGDSVSAFLNASLEITTDSGQRAQEVLISGLVDSACEAIAGAQSRGIQLKNPMTIVRHLNDMENEAAILLEDPRNIGSILASLKLKAIKLQKLVLKSAGYEREVGTLLS